MNSHLLYEIAVPEFFCKKFIFKKSADDNKSMKNYPACKALALKAAITTAADDKFCDTFPNF